MTVLAAAIKARREASKLRKASGTERILIAYLCLAAAIRVIFMASLAYDLSGLTGDYFSLALIQALLLCILVPALARASEADLALAFRERLRALPLSRLQRKLSAIGEGLIRPANALPLLLLAFLCPVIYGRVPIASAILATTGLTVLGLGLCVLGSALGSSLLPSFAKKLSRVGGLLFLCLHAVLNPDILPAFGGYELVLGGARLGEPAALRLPAAFLDPAQALPAAGIASATGLAALALALILPHPHTAKPRRRVGLFGILVSHPGSAYGKWLFYRILHESEPWLSLALSLAVAIQWEAGRAPGPFWAAAALSAVLGLAAVFRAAEGVKSLPRFAALPFDPPALARTERLAAVTALLVALGPWCLKAIALSMLH